MSGPAAALLRLLTTTVGLVAICVSLVSAGTGALSPVERHGREIFMTGVGTSEIVATLDGGTRVPGSVLPCSSCHGRDGRGRREGGVVASDISHDALTRPYEVTTATGRRHGPYDVRLLRRAITMGIDAGGNPLSPMMPRYSLSQEAFANLAAFMRRLGQPHDPGLDDRLLSLGVVLAPPESPLEQRDDVRALLTAYFAEVNRAGGIYGRRIELTFAQPGGSPRERADAVRAFIRDAAPFALIGSFTDGAESEIAAVVEAEETPLLAGMASNARGAMAPSRYMRDLFAGLAEQGRALVRAAALRGIEGRRAAVVRVRDPRLDAAADAALRELRAVGLANPAIVEDHAALSTYEVLLFLERGAISSFLESTPGREWRGMLLVPAAVADPGQFENREATRVTLVSFPMLPSDAMPEALAAFEKSAGATAGTRARWPARLATLASAALTVDVLQRVGRALSRDAFLDALDATSQFRSGFAPPLTFGPHRHLGSTGSWVLALGGEAGPVWIDPGP